MTFPNWRRAAARASRGDMPSATRRSASLSRCAWTSAAKSSSVRRLLQRTGYAPTERTPASLSPRRRLVRVDIRLECGRSLGRMSTHRRRPAMRRYKPPMAVSRWPRQKAEIFSARRAAHVVLLSAAVALPVSCGSGPSAPSPSDPVMVIGPAGVTQVELRIKAWSRVTFVNNDTRPHTIVSDPVDVHTQCPPRQPGRTPQPGREPQHGGR